MIGNNNGDKLCTVSFFTTLSFFFFDQKERNDEGSIESHLLTGTIIFHNIQSCKYQRIIFLSSQISYTWFPLKSTSRFSHAAMNSSSSKKGLTNVPSQGTLNLTKLGGNEWKNVGKVGNGSERKTPHHKIFSMQADALSHSNSIEQMLQTKREKKQRQFVPTEKST